jgi:hypothetical protein
LLKVILNLNFECPISYLFKKGGTSGIESHKTREHMGLNALVMLIYKSKHSMKKHLEYSHGFKKKNPYVGNKM